MKPASATRYRIRLLQLAAVPPSITTAARPRPSTSSRASIRFLLEGRSGWFCHDKGDLASPSRDQKYSFEVLPARQTCEVLILYAPGGLERFIAEAGIADPDGETRSVKEAQKVFAAAPTPMA